MPHTNTPISAGQGRLAAVEGEAWSCRGDAEDRVSFLCWRRHRRRLQGHQDASHALVASVKPEASPSGPDLDARVEPELTAETRE
jgi:hypothetical protein